MGWQNSPVVIPELSMPFTDNKLRFVWVTDTHITAPLDAQDIALRKCVDDCNEWRPNALLHTGDIGDDLLRRVQNACYVLRTCQRPVITCLGNHDEYELSSGVTNSELIRQYPCFDRNPFYYSTRITSGDGSLTALVLSLDGNYYDDDPTPGDAPGNSSVYHPGDRYGSTQGAATSAGGYFRMLPADQLTWVANTLASDNSNIVIVMLHYPVLSPGATTISNYAALADILYAAGKPTIGLCGHIHDSGGYNLVKTTDQAHSFTFYKAPALLESKGWCRLTLSMTGSTINVDSAVMQNYTNPGAWVLNAPFS